MAIEKLCMNLLRLAIVVNSLIKELSNSRFTIEIHVIVDAHEGY
jgi:hypothetical protein